MRGHEDDEATIVVGTKRFYRRSNEEAIEFASQLPAPVRWQVHLKRTGVIVDSEAYHAAKADEGRKR